MNYNDTISWMFSQLPMFQRSGSQAYKADLGNTLVLDEHFSHPHRKFKTIHIGGTNGKGSVSSMLSSILQESGLKVGLYTSPHLKDFRERILVNGQMVEEDFVVEYISSNKDFFSEICPSFFEMTVSMAFAYFALMEVDVAVIEVGLGGRLDSTNIINPLFSVITNISFDHIALLGDSLELIAGEKAGIIKQNTPVVIGIRDDEYSFVFEDKAKSVNATISFASDSWRVVRNGSNYNIYLGDKLFMQDLETPLQGNYQLKNIATVFECLRLIKTNSLFEISDNDVRSGFSRVFANTFILGRWHKLSDSPFTICDTAHNEDGIKQIVSQLNECNYSKLHIVLGMVNDKDINNVMNLLPKDAEYYFCNADIPRAMAADEVSLIANSYGLYGNVYASVMSAYKAAKDNASDDDMIYIGGSTFVVAEVL